LSEEAFPDSKFVGVLCFSEQQQKQQFLASERLEAQQKRREEADPLK
jgi:hypothetical protein